MAEVIAVAVPKGGSGKTTTALNLGAALAAFLQVVAPNLAAQQQTYFVNQLEKLTMVI